VAAGHHPLLPQRAQTPPPFSHHAGEFGGRNTNLIAAASAEVRKDGDADHPLEQYVSSPRYVNAPIVRWRDADTDGENVETLYCSSGDAILISACLLGGEAGLGHAAGRSM